MEIIRIRDKHPGSATLLTPFITVTPACVGNAYLSQQHPSLELEEQELAWDGGPEVELGLTNTAARGAVSVGSAARPLAVANVELVLKDLDDTKVSSCSVTNTAAARGAAVSVGSAARPLAVANVELVLKDLADTKVISCSSKFASSTKKNIPM